jgi:hypothetical protein
MTLTIYGIVLIGLGLVYILRPGLFRRGLWMKTSVAIRTMSEDGYRRYMRVLGIVFVLLGVASLAWNHGLAALLGMG